jgi:hypothetical protein
VNVPANRRCWDYDGCEDDRRREEVFFMGISPSWRRVPLQERRLDEILR